jgi:phosphoglycerate kinase
MQRIGIVSRGGLIIKRTSCLRNYVRRGYKKTIENLNQEHPDLLKNGAKVLVRVDFNVPFKNKDGVNISDDTRIREALPTIKYLSDHGAKVILTSHCGRPKGKINKLLSLKPMALRLNELLQSSSSSNYPEVQFIDDCIGNKVKDAVNKMCNGDIILLENTRFYKEEEDNNNDFAINICASTNAIIYVNDAFGTAHRAHASTQGVTKHIKSQAYNTDTDTNTNTNQNGSGHNVSGFLMNKEIQFLDSKINSIEPKNVFNADADEETDALTTSTDNANTNSNTSINVTNRRPFAAIIGGSKISTKITVIRSLMEKCDTIILGGGMIFTFYKALGMNIGNSIIESNNDNDNGNGNTDYIKLAKDLILESKKKGVKLMLPTDIICVPSNFNFQSGEYSGEKKTINMNLPDFDSNNMDLDSCNGNGNDNGYDNDNDNDNGIPDGYIGLDIGVNTIESYSNELMSCKTVIWNGPMGVFEHEEFANGTLYDITIYVICTSFMFCVLFCHPS